MTDNNARIHIAASDPAFPAKREAAVLLICAAITTISTPVGYTQTGTNWGRSTAAGRSVINLHRNRFGWDCQINLRFLTPEGTSPETELWQQDDEIRLQRFYLPTEDQGNETAAIAYLDIKEKSAPFDLAMQILRDRALPWLDAHHAGAPSIVDYLPTRQA